MSEKVLGVLWDLDGVLVDTGEYHYQAWSATFAELNVPFDRQTFRATFGMNNRGILTFIIGEEPKEDFLQKVSECKESLFRQSIRGQVKPLPGVLTWLERLALLGARQVVASSAPPENIEALIDELCLRAYFPVLLSGYDLPGKPQPDTFLKAASLINVPPAQCVVIEDSVAGVEAARRAGMKCIAVTTTNPASKLSTAELIVESLDQLPRDIFDKIIFSAKV